MREGNYSVIAAVVPALALLLGAGLAACGPDDTTNCPNDLPAACPEPTPSYVADASPIFEDRCFECHGPGGKAQSKHDFSTYDDVYRQRSPILNAVYACKMPPADAASELSLEERQALLAWLVCGAPED